MSRDTRVRLTILGGFLGAGKSTWLRHHLKFGVFVDAMVVVNEAAATPVDDALLSETAAVEVLAGGCACCERKPDLMALLRRLRHDRPLDATGRPVERIVVETSGLADPRPIVEAIRDDPDLAEWIAVSEVVVLVDALHGLGLLRKEPFARRQVANADCLIITKLDQAEASAAARLVAALGLLRPGAILFGAVKGVEAALPPGDDTLADMPTDLLLEGDGPAIFATQIALGSADWTTFSVWLSALLHARGDDIFRVKGVVRTAAGRLLVQAVQRIVQPPEILPEPSGRDDGTIVVIGRGYAAEDLRQAWRRYSASVHAP